MPRKHTPPIFISTVIHPVLTEKERARRMKEIERAAAQLIIATRRVKEEKRRKEEEERKAREAAQSAAELAAETGETVSE